MEAICIQAQAALKGLEGVKVLGTPVEEMTEEQKRMTSDVKGKQRCQGCRSLQTAKTRTSSSSTSVDVFSLLQTVSDQALQETKGKDFVERLHASLPKILTSSSEEIYVEAGATNETLVKAYVDWASSSEIRVL